MPNPTPSDLTTYLTTLGVTAISGIDEQGIIDATIAELEQRTGRTKFQGDATTTALRYTIDYPFGQVLRLEIRDCWEVTEVRTGYTGTGGTGTVLTEYDGFTYFPQNHAQRGLPIEAITFLGRVSTEPGSILITGKLGVASSMPSDVFQAILARAAAQVIMQQAGESGSVSEQKQGDRSVKFDTKEGQDTVSRLMHQFDMAVTRWAKVPVL